jgi:hypothetical protein
VRSARSAALPLAVAVLAAVVMSGCTGGSGDAPAGSTSGASATAASSGSSSASPEPTTFPSLVATPAPPVGSVTGKVTGFLPATDVTVGVLAVRAADTSTVLTYQVTAPATVPVQLSRFGYAREGVQLVATQAGLRLFIDRLSTQVPFPISSPEPKTLGPQPVYLYAVFPPLPASVSQVDVQVPGLKPISVPVTRG